MSTMLGPPHPVAMPTVTKMDKLRLAAAKGEMDVVRDLLEMGTPLQPDKVPSKHLEVSHCICLHNKLDFKFEYKSY
jgi:hypothetical protein